MSLRSNIHDTILAEAVAEGNQTAFLELFNLYFSTIGGVVFNATGSLSLAEQVVQDTFVMIWLGRDALPEVDGFEEYLMVLCCNRAAALLKKETMEQSWRVEFEEKDNFSNHFRQQILDGVKCLPLALRQVYELRRIDRLSLEKTCALLGRSERVVNAHLFEAVRELRLNLSSAINPAVLVVLTSVLELRQ